MQGNSQSGARCESAAALEPTAATEPAAEEVVDPEQRKIRSKRKSEPGEVRLSFADEMGDEAEEEAASPRANLSALTAERFEAEAKASRKRSSSSRGLKPC